MRNLRFLLPVVSLVALSSVQGAQAAAAASYQVDYPPAVWNPANAANYSVADRPHDYPIDMVVIHDVEGSYAYAIQAFQDPNRAASAHYVISKYGQITQMVAEHDIAWHAGNWDYNTRSIGIEHEGFAYVNGTFTTAEYKASALLIASICSRWGVPMDRTHVIGHYQVPDPNHPGLFGGSDHHTDPGPYWNWTYYMGLAQADAKLLPSPPHMVLATTAVSGDRSVTLSWPAARSCYRSIDSYDIAGQPGNIAQTVAGTATSVKITGLQNGVTYTFSVTAHNADGQDSITSNPVVPMTVPDAPVNVVATPAGGSAVVSWTPSFDEGSAITGYIVTPYLNGQIAGTPVRFKLRNTLEVVFNLTNGAAYTFTVAAINAVGVGAASFQSNSVVPNASLRQPPAQAPPASPPPPTGTLQSSPAPSPPPR